MTAVVEGFAEAVPVEQTAAPRLIGTDRAVSHNRMGRGRDIAVIVSVGVAEVAWCATLGYAIWALIF